MPNDPSAMQLVLHRNPDRSFIEMLNNDVLHIIAEKLECGPGFKDLAAFRLVCKKFVGPATTSLFRTVILCPTIASMLRWTNIQSHSALKLVPTRIVLHTTAFPDWMRGWERFIFFEDTAFDLFHEEQGTYEAWKKILANDPESHTIGKEALLNNLATQDEYCEVLSSLDGFPNISAVEVKFTQRTGNEENDIEHLPYRQEVLMLVFRSLATFTKKDKSIQSLTIKNLPTEPLPELEHSSAFKEVLPKLQELHIQFCHRGQYYHGKWLFMNHFIPTWLVPASEKLQELTLYHLTCQVGFCPIFCPNRFQLELPNLTSLSLGRLAFTSEDQFNWILKHKTLERLILDQCLINHQGTFVETDLQHWQPTIDVSDLVPIVDDDLLEERGMITTKFHGRWHSFFDRVRKDLVELKEFRIGIGPWASNGEVVKVPMALRYERPDGTKKEVVFDMVRPSDQAFDKRDELPTTFFRAGIYAGFLVDERRILFLIQPDRITGTYLNPKFLPCPDDESPANTCWDLDTRALGALLEEVESRRHKKQRRSSTARS
ncbi:hypothetical protein N0V82_006431 [Gnomoniopsis sp. IMI 355080]|nr:hypothetical protein N0V82_006431 [Gnomoniopsis sp. IMI 355080]